MFRTLRIQNSLPINRSDIVLEIGSGSNPLFRSDVLLDKYPSIQKKHRTNKKVALLDGRPFVVGDAHDLPFLDNSFDFLVARHILEHLNNPAKFMREIKRVSKGACIVSPSPFTELIHGGYRNKLWDGKDHLLHHGKGTPGHKWFVYCTGSDVFMVAKCTDIFPLYLIFHNYLKNDTRYMRDVFFRKHPEWSETRIVAKDCQDINFFILKDCEREHNDSLEISTLIKELKDFSKETSFIFKIKQFLSRKIFKTSREFRLSDLLACPICKNPLHDGDNKFICSNCGSFPSVNDVPILIKEALDEDYPAHGYK